MIIRDFIDILSENNTKELLFEYISGILVPANYHITEVKSIHIDSVDCGGQSSSWDETIIQLWESPTEIGKKDFMKVTKALQILKTVSKVKPFKLSSIVKIEYGNPQFHASHLEIQKIKTTDNQLIMSLVVPQTDCKAKELCGVPEPSQNLQNACAPGSGCC